MTCACHPVALSETLHGWQHYMCSRPGSISVQTDHCLTVARVIAKQTDLEIRCWMQAMSAAMIGTCSKGWVSHEEWSKADPSVTPVLSCSKIQVDLLVNLKQLLELCTWFAATRSSDFLL